MRVVNDREERSESPEFGLVSLITHALMVGCGMATVFLAPLPVLYAHVRLQEPWPKIATLVGALVAILLLEVPPEPVVLSFVMGLFISDGVSRGIGFWRMLASTVLASTALGFGALFISSAMSRQSLGIEWVQLIDGLLGQVKELVQKDATFNWSDARSLLIFEGPFLFIAGTLLSVWFSVGIAAHLGWLKDKKGYTPTALRGLRLPLYLSVLTVLCFLGSVFIHSDLGHLFGGVFRVLAAVMFIKGISVLSQWMNVKNVRYGARSFFYAIASFAGFYMVVAIGVFSPWFLNSRKTSLNNKTLASPAEESI